MLKTRDLISASTQLQKNELDRIESKCDYEYELSDDIPDTEVNCNADFWFVKITC